MHTFYFRPLVLFVSLAGAMVGCRSATVADARRSSFAAPIDCAEQTQLPFRAAGGEVVTQSPGDLDALVTFVVRSRYESDGGWEGRITPPTAAVVTLLQSQRKSNRTDHLPYLLEYGLKHHWMNLEYTGIGRELDVEGNELLAELVRLLEIPKYSSAHEAGWLRTQFHGQFSGTGWSSYQIYVETNERGYGWRSEMPNADRLELYMTEIRHSGKADVGGYGVCHYGCK